MKYISTMDQSKSLSVTVYNENFGVIKEIRKVFQEDEDYIDHIHYLDVAERIEVDSILIEGIDLREINYEYDLVSEQKMLARYLDRLIFLYDEKKATKKEYRLLSVQNGVVVEDPETKEILINPVGQMILPKLPEELLIRPTLIWQVHPQKTEEIKVSYITKGITWAANYVIHLKEKVFNISGWVDIINNAGVTLRNAKIKLIAGDVQRVHDLRFDFDDSMVVYSSSGGSFEEKSFADYHLYTLKNETTVKNNQSKQINFIQYTNIPYEKYYEITENQSAKIMIYFSNSVKDGLGIPLPKGKVKFYSEDPEDGSLEFIGEDHIDHTPQNQTLLLCIGNAFDIKTEGKRLDRTKEEDGTELETYEYKIRNYKNEYIIVKLKHRIRFRNWDMISSNQEYERESHNLISFLLDISPNSEKVVRFKYRIDDNITVNVNVKKKR
jgi:hypothetical protein